MINRISAFLILILLSVYSFSQTDVKFTASNFPGQSEKLSMVKKQIKNADILVFTENNIPEGLKLYQKAYEFNPNNSELNFKIGFCIYNSSQKYNCLTYFEKAYSLNPKVDKKILFYLARANHLNYKFDNAIQFYTQYTASCKTQAERDEIGKYITECRSGKELIKDTANVKILNLGENINSEYSEYVPVITSDGLKMYFTSRRKGTTGGQVADDGYYYEDIYESVKVGGAWSKAKSVGTPLNSKFHDAVLGLTSDGQKMFVYQDENSGDIAISELKGSRWLKPVAIKNINSEYRETKACITSDNKTLYFISNNPEISYGARDIFYSTLDYQGNWSNPINIGPVLNTIYDEVDIFIHPDGRTIYFSSEGHNSMGGLDVFKSTRNSDGNWGAPVNLGYPINTTLDDAFFLSTSSGKTAYYTSVRPEGFGEKDIYEIIFQVENKETPIEERVLVTLVKGIVTDAGTKLPLEAKIEIIDISIDEVVAEFTTNSHSGAYLFNLPSGKNYGINVSKDGYLFHSENFNIADTADYNEVVIDIDLQRIEVGTTIVLKNIFFDYDKATLRPESFSELNRVVAILNKQPKLKIEISGHTDNKGALEYNKQLSKARAKTVVDYLIDKGIAADRLTYEGYAFEKPIATNDTDEGRQLNRRVEFKVISN